MIVFNPFTMENVSLPELSVGGIIYVHCCVLFFLRFIHIKQYIKYINCCVLYWYQYCTVRKQRCPYFPSAVGQYTLLYCICISTVLYVSRDVHISFCSRIVYTVVLYMYQYCTVRKQRCPYFPSAVGQYILLCIVLVLVLYCTVRKQRSPYFPSAVG